MKKQTLQGDQISRCCTRSPWIARLANSPAQQARVRFADQRVVLEYVRCNEDGAFWIIMCSKKTVPEGSSLSLFGIIAWLVELGPSASLCVECSIQSLPSRHPGPTVPSPFLWSIRPAFLGETNRATLGSENWETVAPTGDRLGGAVMPLVSS